MPAPETTDGSRERATPQRLFFALWPDADVRAALAAYGRRQAVRNGRAVAAENLHVTLAFIGGVTAEQRSCLEAAAGGVTMQPFAFTLDRMGFWSRPRILWVGTSTVPAALLGLVDTLNRALVPCGYAPDARPFQAHVTLARKAHRPPDVREIPPLIWQVDGFCLAESITGERGAEYHVLRRWAFGPEDREIARPQG